MITEVKNVSLQSTITADGKLRVALAAVPVSPPTDDQVVVRVEAAPINPSDLLVMLGPADISTLAVEGEGERRVVTARVPQRLLDKVEAPFGQPVGLGYEGSGTVVHAGGRTQHLLGKKVSVLGGAMFCRYCTVAAEGSITLPDDVTAAEGAALFVNPLTALAMIETMRSENHRGLVHTAAASSLGQMLNRACLADGVALVSIVRRPDQVALLKAQGAKYVVDSSSPTFRSELTEAIAATRATVAFDAVGGGTLSNDILHAMHAACEPTEHKHVYIYGMLDTSATTIDRDYGMAWSVSGFVMTDALQKIGAAKAAQLRQRIAREIKTTFASEYKATIGFAELLDPATLRAIAKHGTGQKYLLDPTRPDH